MGCAGFVAPNAHADGPAGYWYVADTGVEQAHDEGIRGKGVTIAVFDSVIDASIPELADADITSSPLTYCHELNGNPLPAQTSGVGTYHGTEMLSYLAGSGAGSGGQPGMVGVSPDATIVHYVTGRTPEFTQVMDCRLGASPRESGQMAGRMVRDAVDSGADIIMLAGGLLGSPSTDDALAYALARGVIIVAGLGNRSDDPTSGQTNGAVAVERSDPGGNVEPLSDTGQPYVSTDVSIVSPGVQVYHHDFAAADDYAHQYVTGDGGNSAATAITAGMLALVKSKWPDATGNQIIQSLIHNTGPTPDHEPSYDPANIAGYGHINLASMLAVDPAKYPDTNPLISQDIYELPSARTIESFQAEASRAAATTSTPTAAPTPTQPATSTSPQPSTSDAGGQDGSPGGLSPTVLLVAGLLILTVIVAAAIVVARRRQG